MGDAVSWVLLIAAVVTAGAAGVNGWRVRRADPEGKVGALRFTIIAMVLLVCALVVDRLV